MVANYKPIIFHPFDQNVRKRLGDEKLLHFLGRFSDLVQIQEKHGGHVLLAEAPRVECSNVIGNAKAAATCPGPSIPERAVHALRQLEREVLRCCARHLSQCGYSLLATQRQAATEDWSSG